MTRFQAWPPEETDRPAKHPEAPAPGSPLTPHYAWCFACGGEQEHGLHLRTTAGDGHTVLGQFTVTEAHQGAPGLAHGGLLACAFDEALGAAAGHLLRLPAVTAKLETDFLRPVPVGSVLHILAKVDGVTGRKIYTSADGRLNAQDGPIALKARALFVTVNLSHFTAHARQKDPRPRRYDINP